MEQTEIQKLRSIILSSLANEPIDATEKELGYSAAMADVIKIIDEQTNIKVKQTAVDFLLEKYKSKGTFLTKDDWDEAIRIEKDRIINAYMKNLPIEDGVITAVQKAENYYNETFKTK